MAYSWRCAYLSSWVSILSYACIRRRTRYGKSAILRELATFGDDIEESYFTDNISVKSAEGRFAAMMWQGKLIIEFGELGGLDKHDIETVKAWITRRDESTKRKVRMTF